MGYTGFVRSIEKHGYRVHLVVDTGSRARSLSNSMSDYDVHFVYQHPTRRYFSYDRTAMEATMDRARLKNMMDFPPRIDPFGIELTKFLAWAVASNPKAMEVTSTDVVYQTTEIGDLLRSFAGLPFRKRAVYGHYVSQAKRFMFDYGFMSDYCSVKTILHFLASTLAARWVEVMNGYPPLNFDTLCGILMDQEWKEAQSLANIKRNGTQEPRVLLSKDFPAIHWWVEVFFKDKGQTLRTPSDWSNLGPDKGEVDASVLDLADRVADLASRV